ncbi:hypothetical protein ACH5RR_032694 [Cinchona calisaya]|uniref:Transposase n=1 Tax=Cinchona calisaya TaxID=153742 RepID=A0ABD2YIT8_9GENT
MIDNTIKDSIYEKIIGPKKPGRMHTYGMGPTPKDIRTSNHTSVAQKKVFDDTVNEKIEAMRIQMSAEVDAKLCRLKEGLISHFEERIRNLAPLQKEMSTPQQSLLRGSFEVRTIVSCLRFFKRIFYGLILFCNNKYFGF